MIPEAISVEAPPDVAAVASGRPVAYVLKMFPRLSETFIVNEVQELRRRGVPVKIVSLMRPTGTVQSDGAQALARGCFVIPQPGEPGGKRKILRDHVALFRRAPGRYLRTLGLVARRFSVSAWKRFFQAGPIAVWCRTERVSHLHAGFAHVPASVVWWVSRLTGIPFSFAAHAKDLYLSDPVSLRRKMDAARFVWTCTEANARHLRSLGSRTEVHVGFHGCDLGILPFRARASSSDRPPRVLAVGRLVPKKGLDDLLRAASILARRGRPVEIRIVGDGPERESLRSLADDLGLNGQVQFAGSLAPSHVTEEYSRADLCVLPSVVLDNGDRDGIPNVLVEAMATGTPVVSTRISAIPELVRDGETGLLVPPRDPERLASAIEEALDDRPASLGRALAARSDIEKRFDLHRNSERIAALLERHRMPTRCVYVSADLGVPVRGHKGASAHVRQVAEGLAAAGVSVHVFTPVPGPPPPDGNEFPLPITEVPPPGWATRWLDRSRDPSIRQLVKEIRRLAHNLSIDRAVRRVLHDLHPDFVYERYALCSFATGIACRRLAVPWILEVNAPLAREEETFRGLRFRWLTRLLERSILRRADRVLVVSHELRRWALEIGVDPDRVEVMPNGVDLSRFHTAVDGASVRGRLGWTAGERVVGFAGTLKPWHGGLHLAEAFAQAHQVEPDLRLLVIGDGPERGAIEKKLRKKGLDRFAHFTGSVAQDEVPALLRAADLLVAPYLPQEGFYFSPMKIAEYLAVGRPVIASRIGEIPDILDDACGRLVRPGDLGELRRAILDLASDPALRARMADAAAARAAGNDWGDRVRRIVHGVRTLRDDPPAFRDRVGYVLKMFPRFSETFIVNEIQELERMGTDVRVFSMKRPSGPLQEDARRVRARTSFLPAGAAFLSATTAGAHLRCAARSPRRYLSTLAFAVTRWDRRALTKFGQAAVVADMAHRERVGHLHSHFASGPTRVAKMASMLSGLPFSFTAHAKDIYWSGHRHRESHKLKKRIRLARFVVTVSQENQRHLESLGFRVKEGRIRPIYIGLPLSDFPFLLPSRRTPAPRPLILAVGRLIEKKGFDILIDAMRILRDRGVRFRCVIAGDGPERGKLEERIRMHRLGRSVRLLGAIPLARLRARYYVRARALAQPSVVAADGDRDGIPTVLLEAMATGVPVVSTRVSGIPEAIDSGVDGFLAQPGDPTELAARIEELLGDPSLADRIARAARARVERQFDQRSNAGMLRKLFHRSLSGWPARDGKAEGNRVGRSDRVPPGEDP